MLISSKSISSLDATTTQALASFCLKTCKLAHTFMLCSELIDSGLTSGTSGAMSCLKNLVSSASHHPFTSSAHVRDITCTLLASLGIDNPFLPTFEIVDGQVRPNDDRDGIIGHFAVLLVKLTQ